MNVTFNTNTEQTAIPTKETRYFAYTEMDYLIVGFGGSTLFGVDDSRNIRLSYDEGASWGEVLYTFGYDIANCGGVYLGNGVLLVWLTNGDLMRTEDYGVTWTKVLTGLKPPVGPSAVAFRPSAPKDVMFAEYYAGTEDVDLHVYYSSNLGETWSAVLTKKFNTDIYHFHSVDCFPNNGSETEWLVTSGDTGTQVKWFKSTNFGSTWEVIAGNIDENGATDQLYRTLGVKKVSPNTYMWATDTFNLAYVMAGSAADMSPNGIRKVLANGSSAWAFVGSKQDFLIFAEKVEPSNFVGERLNRIFVSGDSGGSWHKEYEFTTAVGVGYGGVYGIQGPDSYGNFYIRKSHPNSKSIQMKPNRNVRYDMKPIVQGKHQDDCDLVLHKNMLPNKESSTLSDELRTTVYEPSILVENATDVAVALILSKDWKLITDVEGNTNTDNIPAGKNVLLSGTKLVGGVLPKGVKVGVRAVGSNPTSGGVTVTLYGRIYKPNDHRAL